MKLDAVSEKLEKIEKGLEQMSKPVTSGQAIFAGFQNSPDPRWPWEKISKLRPIGHDASEVALLNANGRRKALGWGPALKMIADISTGRSEYNASHLEEKFGFQTLERFKTVGMKQSDGTVHKAAMAEGSGFTGGYIVPPDFQRELLRLISEESFFRPRAFTLPMTTRTAQIPALDLTTVQASGTSAFFGGIAFNWQPEAATITETEPAFRMLELTAYDVVGYLLASNQLLADNAVMLDAVLTTLMSEGMAWTLDYAFLQGLGAANTMPLGIINAPATIQVTKTTAGKFLLPDAANMMSQLLYMNWGKGNCIWIMHPSVLPQLLQMHDYTGTSNVGNHLIWTNIAPPDEVGPFALKMPQLFLDGLPVFWSEKLPKLASGSKGSVLLVDPSKYVIGDRLDVQIEASPYPAFRTNQMAWRIISRIDGRPWLNNPITLADGAYQVSPFISLQA